MIRLVDIKCTPGNRFRINPLLLLLCILSITPAYARIEKGFVLSQGIAACYNPVGLLLDTRVLYRSPLSADTGMLWNSTRIDAGIINEWSPADDMLGIVATIEPIAVFDITIKAGVYKIYPALGFGFRRLNGPDAPVDGRTIESIPGESRWGTWVSAAPTLKAKIAPMIVANTVTVNRIDMGDTNRYFCEIRSGLAHRFRDIDVTNDLYVLFERDSAVCAGINHTVFWVRSTREMQQKIGAIIIATPVFKGVSKVYGVITGGMYLQSRLYGGSFYIGAAGGVELKGSDVMRIIGRK